MTTQQRLRNTTGFEFADYSFEELCDAAKIAFYGEKEQGTDSALVQRIASLIEDRAKNSRY